MTRRSSARVVVVGTVAIALGIIQSVPDASASTSATAATSGPPPAIDAVSCATASSCVAVGGAGGIEVSHNGGRTWAKATVPTRHFIYGVACPTTKRCVVAGDAGTVLVTEDGGRKWRKEKTGVHVPLSAVACSDSQRCTAVGDGDTVIATADGGSRWQRSFVGSGVLDGVSCATSSQCAAVTSSATSDLTTSNGRNWASISVPFSVLDALSPMNGIGCHSGTCISVGGRGLLAVSPNGGATWSVGQSGTSAELQSVACASTSVCVAVGAGGIILATADGGATWVTDTSPTQQTLLGVACPTTTSCVAVGSGGTVVTTSDGGALWTVLAGRSAPTPPIPVLVVGDSFAHTLALGLARNASAYGVTLIDGSLDGCALARGSPVLLGTAQSPVTGPCAPTGPGWQEQYEQDVATDHPELSVLALGPWDLSTRFIEGSWQAPGQAGFDAYYAQQIATAVGILTAEGGRVVITTVPEVETSGPELCVPPPDTVPNCPTETERVAALNTAARTVAAQHPGTVTVIDLSAVLSPHGTFVSTVDGSVVRAADGVHLSEPGGEWLTPWLVPQLVSGAR